MSIGVLFAVGSALSYGWGSALQALGTRRSIRASASGAPGAHSAATGSGAAALPSAAVPTASPSAGSVQSVPERGATPSVTATVRAVGTWEFLVGLGCDGLGFSLNAVAARLIPLFLVQTIVSAGLIVTALLSVWLLQARFHRRDWSAIGAVLLGLVALTYAAGDEGKAHTSLASHWILLAVVVAALGLGAVIVHALPTGAAVVAGLLAGLGFGAASIGVRVLHGVDPLSVGSVLVDPALYLTFVGGAGGVYLYAVALALGSATGATAALVVGETLIPSLVGVVWLNDTFRAGYEPVAIMGFLLAVVGAVMVARFGEVGSERAEV